ncbi:MAG: ATP-dependent RecD-like DNA helicase [Desulfobacterales bacterium]|nr:ATP-dependent RecD-like DNA helicase [Desulfobacterales bacterium]
MPSESQHLKITLEGKIEHVTYHNDENHYTIARLKVSKTGNRVTIVGYMPPMNRGTAISVTGEWTTHPKFGQQLKFSSFETLLPDSVEGIKKYLTSGMIKGIGPSMAKKIIAHFGEEALEVIEKEPGRLLEVDGIGKTKAAIIETAWQAHHAVRSLMQLLQEINISAVFCSKLYKLYGTNAVNIIKTDPYRIADDMPGSGFFIADAAAQKFGLAENDLLRVRACIFHLLSRESNDGHMFAYRQKLTESCASLFNIAHEQFEHALDTMQEDERIVIEADPESVNDAAVYLKPYHHAEKGIADRLKAMFSIPVIKPDIDTDEIADEILNRLAIKLSDEQLEILTQLIHHRVSIITGGPGTGKTTLLRSISAIFSALGKRVLLAAPTGRAARRLSDVTRRPAKTIHKLLGYNLEAGRFEKNPDNPLDADVVIIDEASMIDTNLMFHLISAIPVMSSLVMVGDISQLPSVGAGNVLSDLIGSDRIPVFYLKKIFRQAQESLIVTNAHKIKDGEFPEHCSTGDHEDLSEFYFIYQQSPEQVASTIVDLCRIHIPDKFNLDPYADIQVLTPMHKGVAGTINLNQMLQKALNNSTDAIGNTGNVFKVGDKVMHLRNNYQKEVFNGDIGIISDIDKKADIVTVDYDSRPVEYISDERDELTLAYAISVHKSQGSEYPAVVIPIITHHYTMLQRNLLYTAVTRGEKLVILVGTKKALAIALKNNNPCRRLSGLARKLQ